MAMCEDYPCCGHESGCCPDFDQHGKQVNMVCICGAKLPVDNHSSLCSGCLRGVAVDDCWEDEDYLRSRGGRNDEY